LSVDTNESVFTRADWRNGKLVSAQNIGLPGDTAAHVRWYEFDTSGPAPILVQQGTISPGPGVSTYFGSVAINAGGDIGLTYMESSATEFVSMDIAGRKAADPLGTMTPGVLVAAGTGDGFFARAGDYSGIAVDPSDGTTFWAENEYQGNALWNTRVASFTVVIPPDKDWYSVNARAGDTLNVSIGLPASGPGEFSNNLSPTINLYDPQGNQVASGTTSSSYKTGADGTYYVQVSSASGTQGEYVLHVAGATGPLPALAVTQVNPPGGALIQPPLSITVDFNHSIDLPSLTASELTVTDVTHPQQGTITASSFTVVNGHEVTWFLPGGFNGDREDNRVTIAGLIQDISGAALNTFTEDYTTDNVPPTVVASSITEAQVLPTGNLTEVVTFSEPMNPSLVTAASFSLHGIFRSLDYKPASSGFDPSGTVLTINYSNLPDDGYTLTLFSSGLQDLVGLDLSPGNFVVDFSLNLGTGPFPVPLSPVNPFGSLIYSGRVTNAYSYVGDTDSYTVSVDPNQTITVVVSAPHSQATVTLIDPNGHTIGSASASAVGGFAVLQTVPTDIASTGTYTIVVGGVGSAFGLETAQLILNAAVQTESNGGTPESDDTRAGAQDLTSSFINLGNGASRGSVLGTIPGGVASGDVYLNERNPFGPGGSIALYDNNGNLIQLIQNPAFKAGIISGVELGPDNSLYVGVDTSNGGLGRGGNGGELVHFDSSGNLLGTIHLPNDFFGSGLVYPYGFDVAPDGTIWVPQPNSGNLIHTDSAGNLIRSYFVGGNPEDAAVRADGRVFIANSGFGAVQQLDPGSGNLTPFAIVSAPMGVAFASPGGNGDLVVTDSSSGIDYFNSSGGLDKFVSAFFASKGEPDRSGNTFVVSSRFQDLRKFDPSGHQSLDVPLSGSPTQLAVVGVDASPPPPPDTSDDYSFSLNTGQSVTIALTDLSGGQAGLDLEDPSGTILATGIPVSTNVNIKINNYVASTGGTFYIHVTGSGVTYSLVVTRSADFDTEGNDSRATAQNINTPRGVLGSLGVPLAAQTLTFDELPIQPVDGLHFKGVTFGFQVGGFSSADALYGASGLGVTTFTSDPGLEGTTQGVLTLNFDVPVSLLRFGVALSTPFITLPSAATVTLYDASAGLVGTFTVDASPGSFTYPSGQFSYSGTPVSRAVITFNRSFAFPPRFVVDNLTFASYDTQDWYSITADAGNTLSIATSTPADGSGEFGNQLDPHIVLLDSNGTIVATGTDGSDGRNETLNYTVPSGAGGTYFIEVLSDHGTRGEYYLNITDPPSLALQTAVSDTSLTGGNRSLAGPALISSSSTTQNFNGPGVVSGPSGPSATGSQPVSMPATRVAAPDNRSVATTGNTTGFDADVLAADVGRARWDQVNAHDFSRDYPAQGSPLAIRMDSSTLTAEKAQVEVAVDLLFSANSNEEAQRIALTLPEQSGSLAAEDWWLTPAVSQSLRDNANRRVRRDY
jgi:hypothetical protein